TYHDSSPDEKHQLINKYLQEGGIRNIGWIATYSESSTAKDTDLAKAETGYFTAQKIFEREGVVVTDKKRQQAVLEAMLVANYKDNDVKYTKLEDLRKEIANCPELTKYYFVFNKSTTVHKDTKTQQVDLTANLKTAGLANALKDAPASGGIKVKIENPEKAAAKQQATVLQSAKSVIVKLLEPIEDGLVALKSVKKAEYTDFVKEGTGHVEKARGYVDKVRGRLGEQLAMENDEGTSKETWKAHIDAMDGLATLGAVHADGLKHFKHRMSDADCANASNVSDLARGESDENAHRDVLRKLLSQTKWPRLFTFEVPIYDPKTDKESTAPLHMMLPHEVLSVMCRWSALDKLASTEHLRPELKSKLQEVRRFLSESNSSSSSASGPVTIAIGIWCDGVPIKGDKSESLEMLSMSFPGLQSSIRIPLTCLNKKFFLKSGATWDALFKVVAWSCHVMLSGFFPAKRWDGAPLDGQRARMAGQDLGARAALLEIRGDWAMLKASFRMPSWSSKRNCCFVCQATHANMRDVSPHAPWRTKMWSNAELLVDMMENYTMYSPIFEAPFVEIHTFAIDWLHCCDLGVCQDFLGNAMFLMQQKMPGRTVNDRINQLFVHIREYYKQHSVQDQLGALTLLMIRKPNKSPKLRSKAGEARGLVGWVKEACDQFLRGFGESSEEDTCRIAASHLYACYNNLSQESFNPELLSHHCREFLKLYVALERAVNDIDDPASADP
ncbi:unnamed protein product, partial [Symbiodinium sp. KB8]